METVMLLKKSAVKSTLEFLAVALLLTFIITLTAILFQQNEEKTDAASADEARIIVIDAGHGGRDGGASGADGTLEKHINLEIAKILRDLLIVSGYETVMTRETDVMLTAEDGKGSAKMQDLKQRLSIASAYPDALTISIHCNKFPMQSCKGMQVYYSDNETAKKAASDIQNASVILQPYNKRATKKADSSIYLLYRAVSPSVLVECGFLSNPEELGALKTEDYQKKTAMIIFKGISEQ
ncbi:MAG: hypothetical protein E7634_01145 [Ruminococcaceae bacterium]|nr:hypothetical protein [Oscillospiraceae bacterium]